MTPGLFNPDDQAPQARRSVASPVEWRDWPFGDLAPASFDLIMADPPWAYEMRGEGGYEKSPQAHYDCLDIDAICALPVGRLASPNCLLWLWTTWPFLANGAAHKAIAAWGFEPKTGLPWKKLTANGKTAFGTGYIFRSCSEPVLIAVRGEPAYDKAYCASTRGLIDFVAREHSRKPDEAYAVAERLLPTARRLDLFAREARPGWSLWGNQTAKFAAGSASVTAPGSGGASAVPAHQAALGPAAREVRPEGRQADVIAALLSEAGRVIP